MPDWSQLKHAYGTAEDIPDLLGPPVRVTTPHIPLSAANALEDLALPSVQRIVETISKVVR